MRGRGNRRRVQIARRPCAGSETGFQGPAQEQEAPQRCRHRCRQPDKEEYTAPLAEGSLRGTAAWSYFDPTFCKTESRRISPLLCSLACSLPTHHATFSLHRTRSTHALSQDLTLSPALPALSPGAGLFTLTDEHHGRIDRVAEADLGLARARAFDNAAELQRYEVGAVVVDKTVEVEKQEKELEESGRATGGHGNVRRAGRRRAEELGRVGDRGQEWQSRRTHCAPSQPCRETTKNGSRALSALKDNGKDCWNRKTCYLQTLPFSPRPLPCFLPPGGPGRAAPAAAGVSWAKASPSIV